MNMDVYTNRLESFTQPKRGTRGTKSRSNHKWPHPEYFMATPETLAEAGFYFDPSSEDKDNVTCYMCGKELSEWDERDNPFEIHFKKCKKKCAWANVRCGLGTEMDADGRFVFTDKDRIPTSKTMEKARLDTFLFGDGWIHDRERNHGASSKKMAKAGFVYSPHEAHDDTAACIYCGISLSGWDADDDPTEEHRNRVKKAGHPCPMFPEIVFAPPSKYSKSHSRSKSKSSHVDVTMPMKTYDGSDNETVTSNTTRMGSIASTSTAKTPKGSRTAKKGAKTPRSRSMSRTRHIPIEVDEEDGVEVPPPSTAKPPKKTPVTTRSKSVASLVDSDAGTGTEDEISLQRSTGNRSRGKTKDSATRGISTDDDSSAAKKKSSKARSKSKSRVSVIPEDISDEDLEPPPPPKLTKKSMARKPSTRATVASKSTSSMKQNHLDVEDEESDAPIPALSAKRSESMSSSVAAAAALFDDQEEDTYANDQPHELVPATRPSRATQKFTKAHSQTQVLSTRTAGKQSIHSSSASAASASGAKSGAAFHVEEEDDINPLDDLQMHVQIGSFQSIEPEAEANQTGLDSSQQKSTKSQTKPKAKQKPLPPTHVRTDFSDQDTISPPPVPPRSPSRPRTKDLPASIMSMDIDGEVPGKHAEETMQAEQTRMASEVKAISRGTLSHDTILKQPRFKPAILTKSATIKKNGSFLNSRQSRTDMSVDHVMDISSDEDDNKDVVENAFRMPEQPLPIRTEPVVVTNSKPLSQVKDKLVENERNELVSMPVSSLNDATLESSIPAWGSVQVKIAQIEKSIERDSGTSGRTSPFKPKFASTNSFNTESKSDVRIEKVPEVDNSNVQMARLANLTEDKADSDSKEKERNIPPLPVTPPRSEQQIPASPFKTPFRFAMGPGNPFSVPPTPGVPLDIPLGVAIPLSKELFVPTQELSETELSMTVEEWVRYHMQIAYDKFKEDGEREIDAFLDRAEQVGKTIGAL